MIGALVKHVVRFWWMGFVGVAGWAYTRGWKAALDEVERSQRIGVRRVPRGPKGTA